MIEKSAAWIDLLVSRGPQLRAAGVTQLSIDGVSVTLAPAEATAPVDGKEREPESVTTDPLDDDATYGGRGMPGFTRPPVSEEG